MFVLGQRKDRGMVKTISAEKFLAGRFPQAAVWCDVLCVSQANFYRPHEPIVPANVPELVRQLWTLSLQEEQIMTALCLAVTHGETASVQSLARELASLRSAEISPNRTPIRGLQGA